MIILNNIKKVNATLLKIYRRWLFFIKNIKKVNIYLQIKNYISIMLLEIYKRNRCVF